MRLPEGIEIWFAHLWQTILHLQPFTGNGLPWWDCRFSRLGQLCQESYCSCLQTSHTQINGLSWLLSCIVLFMFGFLCIWVVSNMSLLCQCSILKNAMMFFIFCGWKIKSKPRIIRQDNLEDLGLTLNHGSFPPVFFSYQSTGQPAPFLGCSPRTLTHSRLNTPPVQTQGMLSLERLDENCMPKICTLSLGAEYDIRWDPPFWRRLSLLLAGSFMNWISNLGMSILKWLKLRSTVDMFGHVILISGRSKKGWWSWN